MIKKNKHEIETGSLVKFESFQGFIPWIEGKSGVLIKKYKVSPGIKINASYSLGIVDDNDSIEIAEFLIAEKVWKFPMDNIEFHEIEK